jgi:hypothetical protein
MMDLGMVSAGSREACCAGWSGSWKLKDDKVYFHRSVLLLSYFCSSLFCGIIYVDFTGHFFKETFRANREQ